MTRTVTKVRDRPPMLVGDVERLQHVSRLLVEDERIEALCDEILDAAVALAEADFGSMQMLDSDRHHLRLLAYRGFDPISAAQWRIVDVDSATPCGAALRTGERVIVPDAEACPPMEGTDDLEAFRRCGIRAAQTTPLVSRRGHLVGMLSTHWSNPHSPDHQQLQLLDVLARQAADLLELTAAAAAAAAAEERKTFLLQLADALRPLGDPGPIQSEAACRLAAHLGADMAGFLESSRIVGGSPLAPVLGVLDAARRDQPWIVDDVETAPDLPDAERNALGALSIRSLMNVPLIDGGDVLAHLVVAHHSPRRWTADDADLTLQVGERTWAAVERARAETALRESETRYRSLFESIDEGFCILQMLCDDDGRAVDYRYVDASPSFERQTGILEPVGRRMREVGSWHDGRSIEAYGTVAATGDPVRFETCSGPPQRWYDVYAFGVGDPGARHVAVLFNDITERKRLEASMLREHRRAGEQAERARWARELHDETLQGLGAAQMQVVAASSDSGYAAEHLDEAAKTLRTQIANLRALISELRPPALAEYGLAPAIRTLAADLANHHGPRVVVRFAPEPASLERLPAAIEVAVYRVVQESLTNASKHSGARRIDVRIRVDAHAAHAIVRDDGAGFDPKAHSTGFGMTGMRDRVADLDGRLAIRSAVSRGTTVRVVLPLPGRPERLREP